jgi:hypothetical protein
LSPHAARITLRIIGVLIVFCTVSGLLYNATSFVAIASGALERTPREQPVPYLYPAFYTLSAVCIVCYFSLIACAVQFFRLSTSWIWFFVFVLCVEAVVYFGTEFFWTNPVYGASVAAATGISTAGLMPQFLILLPLWAPILVWLARRSLAKA